ncbi:hypothetical protein FPV67DRAFT_1753802 [Lyophyllum atratum]|nr:hypothetical protein FPV67DRAFT_1753802 [Lyophyllum atratum]
MSNTLPPLAIPTPHWRNINAASSVSLPPLSSWSDGRRALSSLSSSPPQSSSPPLTPFSSRSQSHAFIRSSPVFGSEIAHYPSSDYIDELPSTWDRSYPHPPTKLPDTSVTLPGFKSFFPDAVPNTHSTRLGASQKSSEEASFFGKHHRKDAPSQAASYTPVFCDSEEEEQEEDSEGYSFVEEDARATFFRTSSERGQWKYDPKPFNFQSRSLLRQSAPTSSPPPISGLQLLTRPISEPAPSTGRTSTPPVTPDGSHEEEDSRPEVPSTSGVDTISSDHPSPAIYDAPSSLPSLTGGRESTEFEDLVCPSSPLPPSSPPLSSLPSSPMMRSISPLSFAPSSPYIPPSSPLSFADSLSLDHDQDMDLQSDHEGDVIPTPHPEPVASLDVQVLAELVPAPTPEARQDPEEPRQTPVSPGVVPRASFHSLEPVLRTEVPDLKLADGQVIIAETSPVADPAPVLLPTLEEDVPKAEEAADAIAMSTEMVEDSSVLQSGGDVGDMVDVSIPMAEAIEVEVGIENMVVVIGPGEKGKGPVREVEVEALQPKDENSVVDSKSEGSSASKTSALKEKRKHEDGQREGPARKKFRTLSEESGSGSRGPEKKRKAQKESKRRLEEAEEAEEDEEEENKQAAPAPKTKKQKKSEDGGLPKRSRPQQPSTASKSKSKSTPSSSSASSSKPPPRDESIPKPKASPPDPETQALDTEICGMLIESMATSRASCLPASTLYKNVMQCHPALKEQRGEREWMEILERVLHDGEAARGSGVFGKVESSFKDETDRPLEAQWFYVPELDEDQERAALIRSMMPRPGKRSETKKYKQYYYRPLAKISRWDPEDEI